MLVLDAYGRAGRAEIAGGGATPAGELYARRLREVAPSLELQLEVEIGFPADADWGLPAGDELSGFDGLVWTGSSLTVHHDQDPQVTRQVDLAKRAYAVGVPCFGSCWAAQVAVVAAGGACAPNPKGREFGISRKIELTTEGQSHPLFAGKPRCFDALTSHQDEISKLPSGATWLATNGFTKIQAIAVDHDQGSFWAVQYHPEYDLREVARLGHVRTPVLVEQGSFSDASSAAVWVSDLEALHAEPERGDLIFRYGIDEDVLDPELRMREVTNWLEHKARPHASQRMGGS